VTNPSEHLAAEPAEERIGFVACEKCRPLAEDLASQLAQAIAERDEARKERDEYATMIPEADLVESYKRIRGQRDKLAEAIRKHQRAMEPNHPNGERLPAHDRELYAALSPQEDE
jgi:uncharacterized coiled-coil DUF342 family protein